MNSKLYRVDPSDKTLSVVSETEFASHGIKERYDIQEWVESYPGVLGEPLLIIAKEFSYFDKTNERADLIALDKLGNIVVIELKRDDSGSDVHWQAIKYASYFRKINNNDVVNILAKYRNIERDEAETQIMKFVDIDEFEDINRSQRIILVSHRFATEVTSAVLWLLEHNIDIKCIQIVPFYDHENKSYYLTANPILPLQGAENYEICARVGGEKILLNENTDSRKNDDVTTFLRELVDTALNNITTEKPNKRSRWAGTYKDGERYYKLWYNHNPWDNHQFSYQIHVFDAPINNKLMGMKFYFNKEHASNSGLTDQQIETLENQLKQYAEDKSLEFYSDDVHVQAERLFDKIYPESSLEASTFLSELINQMTPIVEDLNEETT
ncbi:MAG: hypothetical protein FH756_10230 [Firmicutes bacterium]|nr:hypothetical protein [Bacillota bacterium]